MARRRGTSGSWRQEHFRRFALFGVPALALVVAGALRIDVPGRAAEGKDSATGQTDQPPASVLQQLKESVRDRTDYFYTFPGSIAIDGLVTDEAGRPIRDGTVGFGPYGLLPFQWNCETDEAGRFRLGFKCEYMVRSDSVEGRMRPLLHGTPSPNTYVNGQTAVPADSLVVGAKGYAATRLPFSRPPGNYSMAIQLKKGLTVRARVVDVEGRPVRNAFAVFVARTPDPPKWIVQYRTDSDAEGRIEWSGACAQDVAIFAGKAKYRDGVGYHSSVTAARAEGGEPIIKLERMAKEIRGIRETPVYPFYAYYVEPIEARDEQFPLFWPGMMQPARPERYDRGYFGCCPSLQLQFIERYPRTLFDEGAENGKSKRFWESPGCPEVRRAPAPFERKGLPEK